METEEIVKDINQIKQDMAIMSKTDNLLLELIKVAMEKIEKLEKAKGAS